MKDAAKDLLNMPLKQGELSALETMQDVNGANLTVEQAVLLKQVQAAMNGSTDAAYFVQTVLSDENQEESDNTEITDAAKAGDTLKMLEAVRDKLAAVLDKTQSAREIASVSRQLRDVNADIEKIKKANERKEGDNPLNVILFNSSEKRAKRSARA